MSYSIEYLIITKSERNFVRDILYDLSALTDPSEYLQEEISQAFEILDKLETTKVKEH